MSKLLIEESSLTAIGDGFRASRKTTSKLTLDEMAELAAENAGSKPEQEKTVNITKNGTTEVIPDEGNTLSKVTVNTSVAAGGEPGKPYIDTSKIDSFDTFCKGDRFNDQIGYLDTSNGVAFGSMFESCTFKTHEPINTSKGKYFQYMYRHCSQANKIPLIDTANGENFNEMFLSCGSVLEISITTAKKDFSTNSFKGCTKLTTLTIGEGWAVSIYLTYSDNLTQESLHGMIENLADLTGQTAKTFQIGATNLAKIDEEHMAMLNAKNWNYS